MTSTLDLELSAHEVSASVSGKATFLHIIEMVFQKKGSGVLIVTGVGSLSDLRLCRTSVTASRSTVCRM